MKYDFTAGDALATKDGWRFHSIWPLSAVPGTTSVGLPFTYNATPDGVYPNNAEMRFDMPPVDEIWLRVRLHEPSNYVMRHNTQIKTANAFAAGWRVGDQLLADDGVSRATISSINSDSVFVRWAEKAAYDTWGNSSAQRLIRNTTRNSTLLSTGKAVWGGDKIMALWVDNYSGDGTGPTIILGAISDWTFGTSKDAIFTAGYRSSGPVGSSSRVSVANIPGGKLFTQTNRGKYIDLAVHVRFSSQTGAKDGVIETWIRYEGEGSYTRRHDIRDADIDRPLNLGGDQQKWQRGYLMGYSNTGYDEQTTFHISRIELFRAKPQDLP
ncbi:MAG: hypothetical protein IPO35_11080 [Uliginosibacterium sp.]|nr:hypothetical protein [Uliginosibacterium sp.]